MTVLHLPHKAAEADLSNSEIVRVQVMRVTNTPEDDVLIADAWIRMIDDPRGYYFFASCYENMNYSDRDATRSLVDMLVKQGATIDQEWYDSDDVNLEYERTSL